MVILLVVSFDSRRFRQGVRVVWSLFLVGLGLGPGRCDLFSALVKMLIIDVSVGVGLGFTLWCYLRIFSTWGCSSLGSMLIFSGAVVKCQVF